MINCENVWSPRSTPLTVGAERCATLRRDIQLVRLILAQSSEIPAPRSAIDRKNRVFAARDGHPGLPRNSRGKLGHLALQPSIAVSRKAHRESAIDNELSLTLRHGSGHRHQSRPICS